MTERALGQIMTGPDTAAMPLIEEPAKQRAHPARTARERARTVRQLATALITLPTVDRAHLGRLKALLIWQRNWNFESISLQRGVRCELDLGEGDFADEIAAAPPGGFTCCTTLEDWPPRYDLTRARGDRVRARRLRPPPGQRCF